ncbi:hypothetical protein [Trinickia sp.]|uniref:hypothetical protein n=1 Tax=Trinickia sp. TaxID=2571163 RepID=UPI003F7D9BF1
MRERLFRLYVTVRNPKYFLWLLFAFIASSLYAHLRLGYDGDFGLTNLILSIEASSAGAVLMVVADASAELCERMLKAILEMVTEIRANTAATLAIAEAQRDMQADLLRLLSNPRVLRALTEKEQ